MISGKKGFVIILVISFLAILILAAWAVINIGCGEIIQTRTRNDTASAFYIASAGAEKMYATLKSSTTAVWPRTFTQTYVAQDGSNIGHYTVTSNIIDSSKFYISSEGTVNGKKAKVVVTYGYAANFFNGPIAVGSISIVNLDGATNPAKLKIEGPVISNEEINTSGSVEIANGTMPNHNPPIEKPSYWVDADDNKKLEFDTNNDGNRITDINGDGSVTLADCEGDPAREAIFKADNAFHPEGGDTSGAINDKDAIYYYFVHDLNNKYDLNIGEGQANHYTGNKSFEAGDVAKTVKAIVVEGNTTINYNDQRWTGGGDPLKHTILSMGNLSITQPTNRPGDVLTLVVAGNVYTTGEMGNKGGTIGDLVVFTLGSFTAENGGKMNASIFAVGEIIINTIGDDQGKDHRMINKSTIDWSDPANKPLGLPYGYPSLTLDFSIDNDSTRKSIWQRTKTGN